MKARTGKREILAEFFRDEDRKLWLNSMTVLGDPEVSRHDGKRYQSLSHYDVDHSKAYGYCFHMSGCGGSFPQEVRGIYWRTDGFKVREKAALWCNGDGDGIDSARTKYIRLRNKTRRLTRLPIEFREYSVGHPPAGGGDLLDWLEHNAIQGETIWCSICEDDLPENDTCSHIWWCDHAGQWSTPDDRPTYEEGDDPDCCCTDCRRWDEKTAIVRWCAGESVGRAEFAETRVRLVGDFLQCSNINTCVSRATAERIVRQALEHRRDIGTVCDQMVYAHSALVTPACLVIGCAEFSWEEVERASRLLEGGSIDGQH